MKKLLLIGALALLGANVNAQESHFKIGGHVGLPIGDAGDTYAFNAGVDIAYTWEIADHFELGAITGYSHYFGKEIKTPELNFMGSVIIPSMSYKANVGSIPVAATAQYTFEGGFNVGADLGYAFLTGDADGGGFYYQPKVGYTFAEKHNVFAGYKGISKDGYELSTVSIGYAYKF